jgi:tellurite resistance protein TerC
MRPFLRIGRVYMLIIIWFAIVTVILLSADVFFNRGKTVTLGSAVKWTLVYVFAATAFAIALAFYHSVEYGSLFLTAYLMEKALSIDNLIVFGTIFTYFSIPDEYQHKILHYGIIGAATLRLIFVVIGTGFLALIGRPLEFVFAALILYSAYKMMAGGGDDGEETTDHSQRWYIVWAQKVFRVTGDATVPVFFRKVPPSMKFHATPYFLCLIALEVSDIMFAFDSVPTVIAVAKDPIIVYPAMMFAILGLRSLYFVLNALQKALMYLEKAVLVVLVFIGLKLLAHSLFDFDVNPYLSLAIVLATLTIGIVASLMKSKQVSSS